MKSKQVKLAIAIPHTGSIKIHTMASVLGMIKMLPCKYEVIFQSSCALHWNRETLVKMAIEHGNTHILFIDTDMKFDPDAAIKLIARDKDIVGVHYNRRTLEKVTTVVMDEETKKNLATTHPDGFVQCDSVGTGFMLINLDVFKKIDHPWFFWEAKDDGEIALGEDYWFCKKAREAGCEVWVDLTIPVKHIGDYFY